MTTESRVSKDVRVPMRDGVELATDVYRPVADGRVPTVLLRSPYDREFSITNVDVGRFVRAGYAVVSQDTRGKFASGGSFNPFFQEPEDGEDTIAWIAEQDWSSGEVVTYGSSYYGATQWLAASKAPKALKAIAPQITSSSYYEGWTYQGGAFQLGFILCWTLGNLAFPDVAVGLATGSRSYEEFQELVASIQDIDTLYKHLPLVDVPVLDKSAPFYFDWLAHPTYDDYWQATAPRERYDQVVVPSLNVGGWYDCFLGGTLENYRTMKEQGGSPAARRPELVIGPWSHGLSLGEFPERRFGVLAGAVMCDITGQQIRFFDNVLGRDGGAEQPAPVRLFIMGIDTWRDEQDWPLPDTAYTPYYLHGHGNANTAEGDGELSIEPPREEAADTYVYDPRDPVPTIGGQNFLPGFMVGANGGPRDQRPVEARPDVLCYTTPPLARDTEVTGPVTMTLYVSSSAVDTDFTAKLVDVHPDGRAVILTDGILRARYRDSLTTPTLMTPGETYELHIDLWATANVFKAGHRIRLEVSSSNFPRFDRNTNTGGNIAEEREQDLVSAQNTVFHDAARPSHVVLPLINRA